MTEGVSGKVGTGFPVRHAENKNVPALRFPEFSGEWEEKRLGDVLVSVDAGWSPQCKERPAKEDEWGVLKTTSVVWDGFDATQNKALPFALTPRPKLQAAAGDILITRAGPISRVAVVAHVSKVRDKLMISDKLMRARTNDLTSSEFLSRLLGGAKTQNYFSARKSGLAEAQANISQSILQKTPVTLPTLPEQKKIAAFLGVVDEKLAALRARRAGLETYKRGLMQKLFSRTLRFTKPDGSAFPDWEEKRLGDLGRFTGGGTPDTEVARYWAGETPWVSSSDIVEGDLRGPRISRWITDEAIKQSATKIVPKGSILLVSRVGVGKLTVATTDLCTSQDFTNFVPFNDVVLFLAYWMLAHKNALLRVSQGTSIKGFTTEDLKTLRIALPHPDEQRLIADALQAMDAKIEAVTDQITQMEAFKTGLLQQMFV